ncbi:MAG: hypothetical protein IJS82_04725 [Paludibacteraceae bacterium]|nr:hypothetical protein [Paludibacteraceae bacterium]
MKRLTFIILSILYSVLCTPIQAKDTTFVSGAIQHEGLLDWTPVMYHSNSYVDFSVHHLRRDTNRLQFTGLRASTRAELTQWPMLGYESDFGGYGISHLSLAANFHWGEITVGDVYAQFGSGLILNLYEDRALGVDGALRGAKFVLQPYKGIDVTLLGGKQRRYWQCYKDHAFGWNYTRDAAMGADIEMHIEQWSQAMQAKDMSLTLGGSFVTKYEHNDTIVTLIDNSPYMYRLPLWVGAGDIRASWQMSGWNMLIEYAYKANDPSADNNFSYRHGDALLASLSYSRKGLAVLAQIKRSDNMSFRSERTRRGIAGRLNHMPAFAQQHTYALASLYPYATQYANGEWAFQAEIRYTFPKKSPMGGKYGTALKLSAAHIRGLASEGSWAINTTSDGEYYTDVNLELNKRLTKRWWLNAMLMYQTYNRTIIEGEGGLVRSGIAVVETRFRVTNNVSMRGELQYLYSPHYQGQWLFALYEVSLYNCVTLSGQYMYNIGLAPDATNEHFYTFTATYTHGAHRLMGGYTKTREGFNCSGGVCRYVPKQQGVTLTYQFTW